MNYLPGKPKWRSWARRAKKLSMWRLHNFLSSLWTFLVIILGVGLLLGIVGNCAYDELSTRSCTLMLTGRDLLRPSVLGVAATLVLLGGLRLMATQSYRRHESIDKFALLKRVDNFSPDDLSFQVLRPGDRPDTYRRPFYVNYLARSISEEGSNKTYTETELAEALRDGKGIVLLGQPL